MSRRIVSLILIPFLMLSQSATFGHSHAGNQPAGHDFRAHIHMNSTGVEPHHHGHQSHKHEGDSHSTPEQQPSAQFESHFDHDSSAVYLNNTDLSTGTRSDWNLRLIVLTFGYLPGAERSFEDLSAIEPGWRIHHCAPPDPASPLFIRHHAILI